MGHSSVSFGNGWTRRRKSTEAREMSIKLKCGDNQCYHDFSRLLFFQDKAEQVWVGSRHQAKKQWLLSIRQLACINCKTHTHTQTDLISLYSMHAACNHRQLFLCAHINGFGKGWKDGSAILPCGSLQEQTVRDRFCYCQQCIYICKRCRRC